MCMALLASLFSSQTRPRRAFVYARNEKLKKATEKAYQKAERPEDGSQPLEWRRDIHTIHLKLINVRLIRTLNVNNTGVGIFEIEHDDEHVPEVESNVSKTISIAADVDQEDFRDRIYFAVETEEDSSIYELQRPQGVFAFAIRPGEARSSEDGRFKDVYAGHLGRNNFEPGEDGIWLDLTAPNDVVDEIAAVLASNPNATLDASVALESFTYEADDAFREWYHSMDMFVDNDHGFAFLSDMRVATGNVQRPATDPDDDDDGDDDDREVEQPQSWSNTVQQPQPPVLNTKVIVAALNGVKIAIYVAAAAIIVAQFI